MYRIFFNVTSRCLVIVCGQIKHIHTGNIMEILAICDGYHMSSLESFIRKIQTRKKLKHLDLF